MLYTHTTPATIFRFCATGKYLWHYSKLANFQKESFCKLLEQAGCTVTPETSVSLAQLCAGHSPLLAAYLHRIGRRYSATCVPCKSADETAEHLAKM